MGLFTNKLEDLIEDLSEELEIGEQGLVKLTKRNKRIQRAISALSHFQDLLEDIGGYSKAYKIKGEEID